MFIECNIEEELDERESDDDSAELPADEQPAVKQSTVEQPAVKQPAVEQPAVEQSAAEQSAAEQPYPEQPTPKQPAAKQPAGASSEQPIEEQFTAEQHADASPEQFAEELPAANQPANELFAEQEPVGVQRNEDTHLQGEIDAAGPSSNEGDAVNADLTNHDQASSESGASAEPSGPTEDGTKRKRGRPRKTETTLEAPKEGSKDQDYWLVALNKYEPNMYTAELVMCYLATSLMKNPLNKYVC